MKKLPIKIEPKRLLIIVIVVVFGFLLMDLNGRLMELSRISDQRDMMMTEVANLQGTENALKEQIDYAESDMAVEKWAREEGHMARPGDEVVIPLPPKDATPLPPQVPTMAVTPVKNWEIWRTLFLGE
jgi:cell division protein FtsB